MHRLLLLLLFGLCPALARADESCLTSELVVDQEVLWDFRLDMQYEIPLPTHRMGELRSTKAVARFRSLPAPGALAIEFAMPRKPGEVGLEYNVYQWEIRVGAPGPDQQLASRDYTAGCMEPGLAFFPGETRKGGTLAIEPHLNGEPRGLELVRIRVWGHL